MNIALTGREELNHLDEVELIARTQEGNTEAFTPIVHRYRQRIYRLIYRQVHDHETAEDLCQEVFLKAWQALPIFARTQALCFSMERLTETLIVRIVVAMNSPQLNITLLHGILC